MLRRTFNGPVALSAGAARKDIAGPVRLAAAVLAAGSSPITVDRDKGVIHGVAVISAGVASPANSFPFVVDDATLESCVACINGPERPLRVRFTHPELDLKDGLGYTVGVIHSARIENGQVRADVTLDEYADHAPSLGGRPREFLLGIAEKRPHNVGMSVAITAGWYELVEGRDHARFASLKAVDFVGDPGGNPNGLLSNTRDGSRAAAGDAPFATTAALGATNMTPKQLAYLHSLGLKQDANDAEMAAFIQGLSADNQAAFAAAAAPATATAPAAAPATEPAAGTQPAAASAPAIGAAALAAASAVVAAARQDQLHRENARVVAIQDLAMLGRRDLRWVDEQVRSNRTVEQVRAAMRAEAIAAAGPVGAGIVHVGDNRERVALRQAYGDAIALRAGIAVAKPHELASKIRHLRVVEMGRKFLMANGLTEAEYWPNAKIAKVLISRSAMRREMARVNLAAGDYQGDLGTFTGLFGDTANRSLQNGYGDYLRQWKRFAREHRAPDFKQMDRSDLGLGAMTLTNPGYDVEYAALGDKRETYSVGKYTSGTVFSWEQMVNDDLGAIGRVPKRFGFMCAQLEDWLAFNILVANAAMADTVALFHATHGNLAGAGAAIGDAAIAEGVAGVMAQTDKGGERAMNLMPNLLIAPATKIHLARQYTQGDYSPAANGSAHNAWKGTLEPLVTALLTGNAWYLACGAGTPGESIEVALLEGHEEPMIEEEDDFDSDVVKMKVKHVAGAAAIDHRGVWKNPGA
jgi:hypothetical protein